VEDRKKYRNQKTSYSARLRNRNHTTQITEQLTQKDEEISELLKIVSSCVSSETASKILKKATEKMPDTVSRLKATFDLLGSRQSLRPTKSVKKQ